MKKVLFEHVGGNVFRLFNEISPTASPNQINVEIMLDGVTYTFIVIPQKEGMNWEIIKVTPPFPEHVQLDTLMGFVKFKGNVGTPSDRKFNQRSYQFMVSELGELYEGNQFKLREVSKPERISSGERNKIGMAFKKLGLDGNGRFEKIEAGLAAVTNALSSLGFQLDMVSKDMIMGDKGSRNFIYRRSNAPGQDPYTEKPEISNSRIVFTWERLDGPSSQYPDAPHKFEILAYAS